MLSLSIAKQNSKKSFSEFAFRLLEDDPKLIIFKYVLVFGLFAFVYYKQVYLGFCLLKEDKYLYDLLSIILILLGSFAFGWRVSVPMALLMLFSHIPITAEHFREAHYTLIYRDVTTQLTIVFLAIVTGFSADILKKHYFDSKNEETALRKLMSDIFVKEEIAQKRFSKVMQDDLLQSLAGILFKIESQAQSNKSLTDISYHLRRTIEEIQAIIFNFDKTTIEKYGFETAVNQLVGTFLKNTDIKAFIDIDAKDIDKTEGRLLLKILHESLLNINKHAAAQMVEVHIYKKDDNIKMFIKDDGIGFQKNGTLDKKYGLRTMRERVILSGGEFEIRTAPNRGTAIKVVLPVAGGNASEN